MPKFINFSLKWSENNDKQINFTSLGVDGWLIKSDKSYLEKGVSATIY